VIAAAAADQNIAQSVVTAANNALCLGSGLGFRFGFDELTRVKAKGLMLTASGQHCLALIDLPRFAQPGADPKHYKM